MDKATKHGILWRLFQDITPDNKQPPPQLRRHFNALVKRYKEPHRGYHNIEHLLDLKHEFDKHRSKFVGQEPAIIAALFYHDAIYNCQPGQDERDSAKLARLELTDLGIPSAQVDMAVQIIEDTASHATNASDAAKLFLDMDMSILAAEREKYKRYVQGVTKEFCTKMKISKTEFAEARKTMFLEPVLNGKSLFKTDEYKKFEDKARKNIKAELNGFS